MNTNIFREYDIRGVVDIDLTDEVVYILAKAFGTFFQKHNAKRVSLGYDARESSPRFRDLMIKGLTETGCDVVDVGMVPTPVLYFTQFHLDVDAGVMITGSHNPSDNNGFKVCLEKTTIHGAQIQEIKEFAVNKSFAQGEGTAQKQDVLIDYHNYLKENIKPGNRKIKVVVDGGNGMGGITGVPLYKDFGCDVIELFCDPDSRFPNHHPDPTVIENMQHAIEAVAQHDADLAIAFDGDGDRIGVVDEKGNVIWGDQLMVIYSRSILEEKPGATFIAEVKCSRTLFDDIAKHGGNPIMWKVGHSLIKSKMKEVKASLAGEMSGHIFFADRYFGYDDATYAGARLLEILSRTNKPLSALLEDLPKTVYTPEIRVDCADEKKFEVVRKLAEEFKKTHDVIDLDGARINFEYGWGLVRASNTQPVLVMRFEADTEENLKEIRQTVENRVKALSE
jgi:phosphomannomutase/phosphoglucomutase